MCWEDLKKASSDRQILQWRTSAEAFLFRLGERVFSLYVGARLAFHFDLEGRLRRAYVGGMHYLRGLDGRVLRKTRLKKGEPSHRQLFQQDEVRELYTLVYSSVGTALKELEGDSQESPIKTRVNELLSRAFRFHPEKLFGEAGRFLNVYNPLGVLPPDCYRTLILQLTTGCSYNRCSFCSLYREVDYRQKTPREFFRHVLRVKEFLGRALNLRKGVFLGEANALEVRQEDLLEIMAMIGELVPEVLNGTNRTGIYAFSDVFSERTRGPKEYRQLRELGLRRVYLGIESGDDSVLRRLRKPATQRAACQRVGDLKEAGLSVGLIFLVGAGGSDRSEAHVEGSVDLVRKLDLDNRDIIYLSPLSWPSPQALSDGEDSAPSRELPKEKLLEEERLLARSLRSLGARVGRYELESFVYY